MKTKRIFFTLFTALVAFHLNAQNHKIIFQLVSSDTLVHKTLMKQLGNIFTVSPTTRVEVVCHGPGIDILRIDKSLVKDKVTGFIKKGVVFNACEFSMKDRKIDRKELLEEAKTVPAGIIEIVTKQEQGWSYIKAGF